jgi:predicted nicotinamide N-methyase
VDRQSVSSIDELSEIVHKRSYVTYTFVDCDIDLAETAKISLLESKNLVAADGTTGLRTWEASIYLTCWLSAYIGRSLVTGRRVLELGAGSGLISTFCAKYLEPRRIIATDGNEEVVEMIKENLHVNNVSLTSDYDARQLLWEEDIGHAGDRTNEFDLILGADIVCSLFSFVFNSNKVQTYDPTSFPALFSTLRKFAEITRTVEIVLSITVRSLDTFKEFLFACGKFTDGYWVYRRLIRLEEAACFAIRLINYSGPGDEGPFYKKESSPPILILKLVSRPTSFHGPHHPSMSSVSPPY